MTSISVETEKPEYQEQWKQEQRGAVASLEQVNDWGVHSQGRKRKNSSGMQLDRQKCMLIQFQDFWPQSKRRFIEQLVEGYFPSSLFFSQLTWNWKPQNVSWLTKWYKHFPVLPFFRSVKNMFLCVQIWNLVYIYSLFSVVCVIVMWLHPNGQELCV